MLARTVGTRRRTDCPAEATRKPGRRARELSGARARVSRRRGVTLVEMLVTVAVLVIMMTILVQIFQAATGSVSTAQAYAQLDDQLRRLDGMIRADLENTTSKFTPPVDTTINAGYFEYGENEFADNQGEDGDDYIRFTAKAPAGQPFTGRMWVSYFGNGMTTTTNYNNQPQPITITSDYAEIIYFVRNGNLYRRVLLIVPELQAAVAQSVNNTNGNTYSFYPTIFGGSPATFTGTPVSWQGVNDLSARPAASGNAAYAIVLNTLSDLTNRENRAFMPRYGNDFLAATSAGNGSYGNGSYIAGQDGIPDDINGDNIADLYPSLYPGIFNPTNLANQLVFATSNIANTTGAAELMTNPGVATLAFPYVFPGAYSKAQWLSLDQYGWIHAPGQYANAGGGLVEFDTNWLTYCENINHNPLDVGDNLPTPINPAINGTNASQLQTWWGFPTWRETLSPYWNDPTVTNYYLMNLQTPQPQPTGLNYSAMNPSTWSLNASNANLLPPMADPSNFTGNFSIIRQTQQLFCDGAGTGSAFWPGAPNPNGNINLSVWQQSWEDDLIMTGVRSFDVKAYEQVLGNYADLGWGDDARLYLPYTTVPGAFYSAPASFSTPPLISSTPLNNSTTGFFFWPPINPTVNTNVIVNTPPILTTFAHEGRMPPLQADNRLDYQYPNGYYLGWQSGNFTPPYPAYPNYSSNVGDDSPGIVRLRRVWDSWSTEYSSYAPAIGVNSSGGFPTGPISNSPPVYPSYPPPYPAPLRGIQIQIRVVDPSNQRIKSLTIRQDFTDKL